MESFTRLSSRAGGRGRRRRTGFVAATIALAATVLAGQGLATAARGYSHVPSSSILADHGVSYLLGSRQPGTCPASAPQRVQCASFFITVVLKRSAASVVVSFDGLQGKFKRPKVKPGHTPTGVPYSTGTFFADHIPTLRLLNNTKAGRGSGGFPAVGKPGYGTFDVAITLNDGSRITTDFRAYLKRGWL
jgi:hypothetical protein